MIKTPKSTFILVDGSFYLYRAYYAFPTLTNSKGEPIGAIYGVLSMLRSLITQYNPSHVAVIFDTKGKTFRNKLFKYYKSNRPSMPKNLIVQIEPLYAMLKAMGLSIIAKYGVEADDIIGTLALKAEKMGYKVLISTNDKDMAQLVTRRIYLINTMNNTFFDAKKVMDKYGVPPKMIVDLIALAGDSSDNIPGVPGIGEKTAQVLIDKLGGLNILYSKLEKIADLNFRGSKTIAKKLEQNKEIAFLSYRLASIKTDVKIDLTYEQLKVKQPLIRELLILFKKYEFKYWINNIEIESRYKSNFF